MRSKDRVRERVKKMFRSEATNFLFALDFDTGMYYNKQVRVRRGQKME